MSTFATAFGEHPFADDPDLAQYQVVPPFATALQSTAVEVVLAVELTVAAIATPGTSTTLYLGTHSFATLPTDDVDNEYIDGRVLDCRIRRQVEPGVSPNSNERDRDRRGDFTLLTSGLATAYASITLDNADGALDDWPSDYYVDGRRVTIKAGFWPRHPSGRAGTIGSYDDFGTVFVGWSGPWERGVDTLTLTIQGIGQRLRKPMGNTEYLGTGSSQGPEELTGISRQQTYGVCYSVETTLVDDDRQIRDLHDASEINEVMAVYVRGVSLVPGSAEGQVDWPDYASLRDDAMPAAGEYATCLARGSIKLGSDEQGLVTADVWGDKAANRHLTQEPWSDGTYWSDNTGWAQQASRVAVDTIAGIVWRQAEDRAGLTAAEINENSLRQYDLLQPEQTGFHLPTGSALTCIEGIGRVAASDHAFAFPDQYGRLAIRRLDAPADNSPHRITDLAIVDIEQIPLPYDVAPYRWRIWYRPNWRRFAESEIASGLAGTGRAVRLTRWGRMVAGSDTDIEAAHPSNRQADLYSFFVNVSAATALRDRMFALYALGRGMWRVTCYGQLFRIDLGETVHLTSSRFKALESGRYCIALAVEEDPVAQTTELVLFG